MTQNAEKTVDPMGARIAALRNLRGLTQAALGQALNPNKSLPTIYRWEKGQGLDLENIRLLEDFFGVPYGTIEGIAPMPESLPEAPGSNNPKTFEEPDDLLLVKCEAAVYKAAMLKRKIIDDTRARNYAADLYERTELNHKRGIMEPPSVSYVYDLISRDYGD